MTAPFNRGTDCRASGSGGWCASAEDCQEACQVGGLPTSAQLRAARAETDRVVGVLIKMRAEREELQAELAKTQATLAASQADLTAAQRELGLVEHKAAEAKDNLERWIVGISGSYEEEKRLHAVTADQLANAVGELNRLRPIAAAAKAYVRHPALPPTRDPNEAHAWDVELMRLDNVLRTAVLQDGGA